jgi:outer membrane protein TolC
MRKKIVIVSMLFLSSFVGRTQTFDLEHCLKMADTANPIIRNAKLDVAITTKQVLAYETALLPKLFFAADYKYNAIIPGQLIPGEIAGMPQGTFVAVQFGVPYNLSNALQLNQILYNPQVNAGIKALKVSKEVSEIQSEATTQNVKYQLIQTYYNLQALNKQLAFVKENIINLDKMYSNMQAMYEQKMIIATELDKMNITRLALKNQEQTLISNKEKTENYLKLMIGKNIQDKIDFQREEDVQKPLLIDQKTINPIDLKLIQSQQKLNDAERQGINMSYLPVLSMYGTALYSYNYRPESDFGKGINGAIVGLKLDWTLFDGLEKMYKAKQNKLSRQKLDSQLDYAKKQLEVNTENAKKQVENQLQSLVTSQEQLVLAEKVQNQAKYSYEQGVISSNDFLKSENDLYQAQTNVVVAYVQLRMAELELLKITGNIK